ncbi:MAG: response regulator [Cytophagales bacterium]|nr:response regulator [Cytophagales bacterium]
MGKKILVAEDSSVLLNLMKRILSEANFEIKPVKNGQQVLDSIEKDSFDLVLMDINMPKVNGIECSKKIRAHKDEQKKQIPIIAVTGNAMNMTEDEFSEVGINDFLPKPIDFDKLVDLVKKWTEA